MKKRLRRYAVHIGRFTWHVGRWTWYASAAALALLAILLAAARFLLPMIAEQKSDLEQYLSRRSGHQVRIERLAAYWDGLHPGAHATGLQVYAADGAKPAIRLGEARLSLALLPLLWGKLEINSLVVIRPSFALERLSDGRFRITGFDPLRATERTEDEKFVSWLFQQGRLQIENGELQWFDHRGSDAAVHLSRVNLSLRNRGDRHRLDFSAEFPPEMCRDCSLTIDITGNPLISPDWEGEIYLRAAEVGINALPRIAREKLPAALRGKFTVQLRSDWEKNRPVSVRGHVQVTGLRLPLPGWDSPLGLREVSGDLSWQAKREGWRLDVANPMIGLTGPAWAAGRLRIVHQPDESQIQAEHLNVGDITAFVARVKGELTDSPQNARPNALLASWLAGKPEGAINHFNLRLFGDWTAPEDFSLEADIDDGAVSPYREYPGVQGLSGHLSLSRESGNFRLDSTDIAAALPRVFRAPLAARRASGDLAWEKYADYWLVNGNDLRLEGEDVKGSGKLSLRLPLDKAASPHLKLRVDFRDGNGAHAARYYPAYHLAPSTLAWMERAFLAGEITKGYLVYDGPIRRFPFQDRTGKFELRGHVRRGVYRFLPGWEPVRQAEVEVAIHNDEVLVTGYGKIGALDATQVVVQSRAGGEGQHVIHVSGKVTGALNETLNVLHDVKPEPGTAHWLAYLPPGLRGGGEGVLSLDIAIPLNDAYGATRIDGDYRFLKNSLLVPGTGVSAEAIEGNVRFTEAGILEGGLRARFLGGDTVLTAKQDQGQLALHGQGAISAAGLAPIAGARIAPQITGHIPWSARWRGGKAGGDLRAEAELRSLKAALPPPLDRPEGLAEEKFIVRTESSTRDGLLLALSVGDRMNGKLAFAREANGWRFTSGRIGFGEERVALPRERGLHLSAHVEALNLDQWWPWFGAGPTGVPAFLTRTSVEVKSLEMFDRRFGALSADFSRSKDVWSGTVNGASMAGGVKFSGKGSAARFDLDLARLALPEKQHQRRDVEADPRRLPTVLLRSKSFYLRDKALGELDFMAEPGESGWSIRRFHLTRPEMKFAVSGDWQFVNNRHASEFDVEFSSTDMGKTMEAFGAPDQVAGGEVSVKSHLAWPGSPANPQLATLNGRVELSAKKGRFLQVKQGAGRLFGLLDLSAINRYLTLDFSPVFGKGFIYDQIHGTVTVEMGNAYSRDFQIKGPATAIRVSGRAGLAAEDYDLTIEIQPKLSDAVTIATWGVWGPQVAAVVLAVQKIFKKQIAAGTRITYAVKGPWDNPVITRSVKNGEAAASRAGDETVVR